MSWCWPKSTLALGTRLDCWQYLLSWDWLQNYNWHGNTVLTWVRHLCIKFKTVVRWIMTRYLWSFAVCTVPLRNHSCTSTHLNKLNSLSKGYNRRVECRLLLHPLSSMPPVTGRDESRALLNFWRHHLPRKLASSILKICRRKRSFHWYPDQSDQLNEGWNMQENIKKFEWKTRSKISMVKIACLDYASSQEFLNWKQHH